MATINLLKGAALGLAATVMVSAGPTMSAELKSIEEIKKEYAGKVNKFTNRRGNPMTMTFRPDGTLEGEVDAPGGRVFSDSGKWWVPEAGKMCRRWNRWQDRRETCIKLVKEGGISIHEKAGKKKLTDSEIKAEIIDHSLYSKAAFNSRWTDSRVFAIYYNPNGRYWVSCCEHDDWRFQREGNWKIADNEICRISDGNTQERCSVFFRDGEKLVTDRSEIISIEKGDKF